MTQSGKPTTIPSVPFSALDNSPQPCFVALAGPDGLRLEFANRAGAAFLEPSDNGLTPASLLAVLLQTLTERLQESPSVELEHAFEQDGQVQWMKVYAGSSESSNRQTVLITWTPITEFRENEFYLHQLHDVTASTEYAFREKIRRILWLGLDRFRTTGAGVARVSANKWRAEFMEGGAGTGITEGLELVYGRTLCKHVQLAGGPVGISDLAAGEYAEHPALAEQNIRSYIGTPLIVSGIRYGSLFFFSPDERSTDFNTSESELIRLFAQWVGNEIARDWDREARRRYVDDMRSLAITDPLTGLRNRRYFMTEVRKNAEGAEHGSLALAIIDADHFKQINDNYGHASGDAALLMIARNINDLCQGTEGLQAARIGGEEFALLYPCTDDETATEIAEELRSRIAEQPLILALKEDESAELQVGVSAGVAVRRQGEDFDAWLSRADAALYAAKEAGRGRVELSD